MKNLILLSILFIGLFANSQSQSQKADLSKDYDGHANLKDGIVTKESKRSFEDTYNALKSALEANPAISIMAEIDHKKNAENNGLELSPTRLIIFGNPNMGTPLMQEEQSIALDLPQKMLVWENAEGKVFVSFNDPYYVAERHSVENNDELLDKMDKALNNLAKKAAGL